MTASNFSNGSQKYNVFRNFVSYVSSYCVGKSLEITILIPK